MVDFLATAKDIFVRMISGLTSKTTINQMSEGGKARAILETVAVEVKNIANISQDRFQQVFITTATGASLKEKAAEYGLQLAGETNASVLDSDRVIKFYSRLGGNFGSINNGSGFTIPSGTILTASPSVSRIDVLDTTSSQDPNQMLSTAIHYSTSEDVYCDPSATEAWVTAEARTPGASGNLPSPNMLTQHSFVDYSGYLSQNLMVTNTGPILNGSEPETEGSLRFRTAKATTSSEAANESCIRNAGLKVPGVAELYVYPYQDGAGSFTVYLKSISSFLSDRSLADAEYSIKQKMAAGIHCAVKEPYIIGIELNSTITYDQVYSEAIKTQIRANLASAATTYINSLNLGATLDLKNLASELRSLEPRVRSLGSNNVTVFDNVYLYFPARFAPNQRRREKMTTVFLAVPLHARVIVERSISSAIRFK